MRGKEGRTFMMESFRGAWRDEEVDSTRVKYRLRLYLFGLSRRLAYHGRVAGTYLFILHKILFLSFLCSHSFTP